MKKVLSLVLVLVLCFSLVACSGTKTEDEKFLVGAIYINGQNDTAGYTFAHHSGITKAMEQLGMDKSQLKIVDNVAEDDAACAHTALVVPITVPPQILSVAVPLAP